MPELESLFVRIDADLSRFRRELDDAESAAKRSTGGIARSFSSLFSELERDSENFTARLSGLGFDLNDLVNRFSLAVTFGTAASALAKRLPLPARPAVVGPGAAAGFFSPQIVDLLSGEGEERASGITIALKDLEDAQSDAERRQRSLNQVFEEGPSLMQAIQSSAEAYGEELTRLPNELALGTAGQQSLNEAIHEGAKDLRTAQGEARSLNDSARDLGFTFASAFEDAVVEGRRLSDVVRGLEQDILRILTRKLVTEPLAGAVTDVIGRGRTLLGAALFHGGGAVGTTPVSGRVVPSEIFAGAPRFASGGIVGLVPRLAPGEVPAILHRGEVVRTPAQEAAVQRRRDAGGDVVFQPGAIVIQAPSPQAFNESRGQIEAMLADAVRRGRRNR
ncbi:MAG: hypothetical protein ACE5GS_06785 [Kiloniellaceae bacterium]